MLEQEGQPNLILIYVVRVQLRKDFTVDLDGSIQGEGLTLSDLGFLFSAQQRFEDAHGRTRRGNALVAARGHA